jgi:hypothetical protein
MGKEPTSNEKWKDRSDSGEIITEPTIVERLRNLEKQFISTPNRYAAEVCHRASEKLEALSEINEKFVTDWNNLCRTNAELQEELDKAELAYNTAVCAAVIAENTTRELRIKLQNSHVVSTQTIEDMKE